MVLNNVTKVHIVVAYRPDTIKMVNFHEQKAIIPEGIVRHYRT